MRTLFITKRNNNSYGVSLGLVNSAKFVVRALNKAGIESKLVVITDNNSIDREVKAYKPDVVFLEALWVVPEKFDVLEKLYPNVVWVVRIHSRIPYLSNEGIAIQWIKAYLDRGVIVAFNNLEPFNSLPRLLEAHKPFWQGSGIQYLPNVYDAPIYSLRYLKPHTPDKLIVGCFGAIRPLKNQLQQAIAAMIYADQTGRMLEFHINAGRVEKGETALKNMIHLFKGSRHELIQHEWYTHEEFVHLVRKMDIGMQVSYSESFNIVTADFVNNGVPVVVSNDIDWVPRIFHADPNSIKSIIWKLRLAEWLSFFPQFNKFFLRYRSLKNLEYWKEFLECDADSD